MLSEQNTSNLAKVDAHFKEARPEKKSTYTWCGYVRVYQVGRGSFLFQNLMVTSQFFQTP